MTESFGFSDSVSYYITKSAGIGEVLFGVLLFIFYRSKSIVILNIIGLIGLLLFVAVLQPQLLNNPSVSVLVFKQNGDVVYSKQYGYANLDTQQKPTQNSLFQVASVSKLVTGSAILKLYEQSQL